MKLSKNKKFMVSEFFKFRYHFAHLFSMMEKVCVFTALLFFSLSVSPAFATDDSRSISHYTKGLVNDFLGLTEDAIEEYEKAAQYDRKSYLIHLRLGADYARTGRLPEAIRELKLVSEFNPKDLQSRYLLALIYSTQRNFDEAADQYETILQFLSKNDPQNIEVHGYLGQLYYSQGKYNQAIEQFEKILDFDPQNLESIYVLGSLYIEKDERNKATELFQRGIQLDPNHDGLLNSLAYIYAESGVHLDEALDLVTRALDFDPNNGAYLDTLGWVYYQKGMYLEALDTLRKADRFMQDPVIYEHLGDVYFQLNQLQEARYYWMQSLKLLPAQEHIQKKLDNMSEQQAFTHPENSDLLPSERQN